MPITSANFIIDTQVFDCFCDTVGDELMPLMASHRENTQRYLDVINASLKQKHWVALSQAAHTIKSSHANFGAFKTVQLAREIETLARSPSPDITTLTQLITELTEETQRADAAMRQLMGETK